MPTATSTDLSGGPHEISYAAQYAASRVGWHEVSARGDRMLLDQSDVPEQSPSAALTDYPTNPGSPPNVRRANLSVRPGGDALTRRRVP